MTFIDAITGMVLAAVFLAGFSQAVLPVYRAWEKAEAENRTARTIHFIAESFKSECAKPDRNMESWKKAISTARELESYELVEMRQGEILRAIKAKCIISGVYIEIIGLCTP